MLNKRRQTSKQEVSNAKKKQRSTVNEKTPINSKYEKDPNYKGIKPIKKRDHRGFHKPFCQMASFVLKSKCTVGLRVVDLIRMDEMNDRGLFSALLVELDNVVLDPHI